MQRRAFSPEDALAAAPLRREGVQLGLVALLTLVAALTPYGWLRVAAGIVDCLVAVPALVALVVAWRTIGTKPQLLVYAFALPALAGIALWNFAG